VTLAPHADGEARRASFPRPPKAAKNRLDRPQPAGSSFPNTEFRIPNWAAGMIPLNPLPNLIDQVYARIIEAIIDRHAAAGPADHPERTRGKTRRVRASLFRTRCTCCTGRASSPKAGRRGFEVTQLDPARIRQLYEVRGRDRRASAAPARGRTGEERCVRPRAASRPRDRPDAPSTGQHRWQTLIAPRRRFPSRDLSSLRQSRDRGDDRAAMGRTCAARWQPCLQSSITREKRPGPNMRRLPPIFSLATPRRRKLRQLAHAPDRRTDDGGEIEGDRQGRP